MIKNLLITKIPKETEALKKALFVVKDYSWSKEALEAWGQHGDIKFIWYDKRYGQYVMGGELPSLDNISIKTYEEVMAL